MSNDLAVQLGDYLDDVARPVTVDEVVASPIPETHEPALRIPRGPWAAVVAAGLVFLVVAVPALLVGPGEDPTQAEIIIDEIVSASDGPAHFAVGFDRDGELCARAGSATQGEIVCGRDGPTTVAFQAFTRVVVAGYVPDSTAEVNIVYGDRRRRVDLVPVPDRESLAFGTATLWSQPGSVEVEMIDDRGMVTERQVVPVGSIADALGWQTVPIPDGMDSKPDSVVWTGTELIFGGAFAYAPEPGTWRELQDIPAGRNPGMTGVWTGTEAIFCCGASNVTRAYRPGSESWRQLSPPPLRHPPAKSVWTGDLMVVVTEFEGVAGYDPERDEWELFEEPPSVVGPDFHLVWTGSELIVWTANDLGIALDPETRTWRTLPHPPDDTFSTHDIAYSGSDLIVWGAAPDQAYKGSTYRRSPAGPPRILDLETNRWEELPPPLPDPEPCECRLRGTHAMVWTGEALLVSTGHASRGVNADEPLLIAYRPDSSYWTYEGVSPLGWEHEALYRTVEGEDRALMADDRVVLIFNGKLYISPPGWQPQGLPLSAGELDALGNRANAPATLPRRARD